MLLAIGFPAHEARGTTGAPMVALQSHSPNKSMGGNKCHSRQGYEKSI